MIHWLRAYFLLYVHQVKCFSLKHRPGNATVWVSRCEGIKLSLTSERTVNRVQGALGTRTRGKTPGIHLVLTWATSGPGPRATIFCCRMEWTHNIIQIGQILGQKLSIFVNWRLFSNSQAPNFLAHFERIIQPWRMCEAGSGPGTIPEYSTYEPFRIFTPARDHSRIFTLEPFSFRIFSHQPGRMHEAGSGSRPSLWTRETADCWQERRASQPHRIHSYKTNSKEESWVQLMLSPRKI